MITKIFAKNFMGRTWTYDIENGVNLFDGPNGNGKTSIRKALLIALGQDTGDDIKQDTKSYYDFYCGSECGEMVVGFETEAGELLRTYKKKGSMEGGDKVTCKISFNDKNILQKTDIMELTGIKIFDPVKFLASTPSQRVSQLCELCDSVTPEELEALDKKIDEATDQKNKLTQERRIKEHALEDTQKSLKDKETTDGVDYGNLPKTISDLQRQRDELRSELMESNSKIKSIKDAKDNASKISDKLIEMQSKNLAPIEGDAVSVEKLELEISELEMSKNLFHEHESTEADVRVAELALTKPALPEVSQEQIDEMQKERESIALLKADATIDKVVYDAFCELWDKMSPLFLEAGISQSVGVLFAEAVGPYKKRIEISEKCLENELRHDELAKQVATAYGELNRYKVELGIYNNEVVSIGEMKAKLKDIGKVEYDKQHHKNLKTELLKATLHNDSLEKNKQMHIEHKEMIEQLTEQLAEASATANLPEPQTEDITNKGIELTNEIERLTKLVQQEANYKAVKALANKQAQDVEDISVQEQEVKDKLFKVTSQKTEMLRSLADTIQQRCAGIVTPWTIGLDIKGGRNGYVRFMLQKPNGHNIPLEVACGGEKVMIFAALTVALLGQSGGVVLSESAELDTENTSKLIQRLAGIGGVQSILFGHAFKDVDTDGKANYTKIGGE